MRRQVNTKARTDPTDPTDMTDMTDPTEAKKNLTMLNPHCSIPFDFLSLSQQQIAFLVIHVLS